MNILVTGGAGFIGSHLVDALLQVSENGKEAHSVTVIDDLSFGHKEYVHPKATFIQADICSPQVREIFAQQHFDVVYHLAAQKNLRLSFEDPLTDAHINILGLINILEASRHTNVGRFIFVSSGGQLYGDQAPIPTPETAPPDLTAPYTVSKYAGELYVQYYAQRYAMNTVSLRFANVYGPRQDPKGEAGVIAIFLERLLQGKAITIFGDGEQTRDYVYIDDIISACLLTLNTASNRLDLTGPAQYNIGTGKETSVNRIAELIKDSLGNVEEIQHTPAIPGELLRSALSSERFSSTFDWHPRISIEEGIQKTARWFAEKQK